MIFSFDNVVMGNASLSAFFALVINALIITLVLSAIKPLMKYFKLKLTKEINWVAIYTVVNIAVLWILARGASYTGFGVSSYFTAIIVGLFLTAGQWIVWKNIVSKKKK